MGYSEIDLPVGRFLLPTFIFYYNLSSQLMLDFETLMFIIAFAPIILIVIFLEVILRYFFSVPKEEKKK